jgi:hypothetical protein
MVERFCNESAAKGLAICRCPPKPSYVVFDYQGGKCLYLPDIPTFNTNAFGGLVADYHADDQYVEVTLKDGINIMHILDSSLNGPMAVQVRWRAPGS